AAGLKFPPSGSTAGSSDVQGATSAGGDGLSSTATASINVGISVANATIDEDTDSGAVVITRGPADQTWIKVTGITGGKLYSDAGFTTEIGSGSFIAAAGATTNVYFRPTADHTGAAGFTVQGATTNGDGGLAGVTSASTVTITAQNDAPTITVPNAAIAVTEDVASQITGISFADVDAGNSSVTATLAVGSGSLSASSGAGVTVGGTATSMTLAGTVTAINSFISAGSVTYTTAADSVADVTLNVSISDGGNTGAGGTLSAGPTAATLSVTKINDTPAFADLNGTPSHTENGSAVVLDADVSATDAELTAADSWSGATLTLARNGGASTDDLFAATGNLATLTEGGNLTLSGNAIGTVTTNSAGSLVLTFGAASGAQVAQVMRSITYANSSDGPPTSVRIDWTLSDGNGGAQGTGGAKTASGSTTVAITPVNDDPVLVAGDAGVMHDKTAQVFGGVV
ncbi:MAG: hypothetical protein HQL41_19425, partial [Alphaproteobacteria bacterium]|nr:hypothetical protein [Alphaproteobacteria bacterium]